MLGKAGGDPVSTSLFANENVSIVVIAAMPNNVEALDCTASLLTVLCILSFIDAPCDVLLLQSFGGS